ncbi:MAG: hypothetical protein GXO96_05340 [Nitrospirae bacterium]|nr:hypothetical protein [Candidatus Manganitrophaceae bacterium]
MNRFKNIFFVFLVAVTGIISGCGKGNPSAGQNTTETQFSKVTVQMGAATALEADTQSKAVATIPPDVNSVKLDISRNAETLFTECRSVTPGQTITFEDIGLSSGANSLFEGQAFAASDCSGETLYAGTTSGVTLIPGENPPVPVNLGLVGSIAPTVITDAAANTGTSCVDLKGTINANGFEVVAWFEWGLDSNYGSQTAIRAVGNGTTDAVFTEMLCGLTPATGYNYRAVASNGGDLVFGDDQAFSSQAIGDSLVDVPIGFPGEIPPSVVTDVATNISTSSATLIANINPEGVNTQAYFEWGLDTSYGNTTPLQTLGNGFDDVTPSAMLTGLEPENTYHFRAVAFNAFGTTVGENQSFPTHGEPPVGEPEVACIEGNEPTMIKYGDHTVDCQIDTNSDGDTFNFVGTTGDVIRIVVEAFADGLDARLEIRDPDGILLHNNWCGGGCSIVVEPKSFNIEPSDTLMKTGSYSILISDQNNDEGGAYGLQLEKIPPSVTPQKILYNVPINDTIDHKADIDFFVFDGESGTDIRITVSAFADGLDARLEVYDPDGIQLHNNWCGGGCSIVVEPNSFNITPSPLLPKTGVYTLIVSDQNHDEGGNYEINIQCLFGACPE